MRKAKHYIADACKTLLIALAACAMPLAFSSCSDDDGGGKGGNGPGKGEADYEVGDFGTPPYAEYAAKYEVTDEGSDYKSIELTESGDFVIIAKRGTISFADPEETEAAYGRQTGKATRVSGWNLSNSAGEIRVGDIIYSVLSGPYTVIDENTFFLERIGTVRVFHDGNSIYSIEITPINDTAPRLLKSTLYDPLYRNSPKTVSLCRTWNFVHFRYYFIQDGRYVIDIKAPTYEEMMYKLNNLDDEDSSDDDEEDSIESYATNAPRRVLFSKFGTYAVFYEGGRMGISTWAWANYARGIIAYSWDNIYDGDRDGNITVWFRGNKTYINEASGYNNGLSSFEEGMEYTLQEVE